MKYIKKPVIIEAELFTKARIGNCLAFVGRDKMKFDDDKNQYYIKTLEGKMFIEDGSFIIKGIEGEFYPCRGDIFKKTYMLIED